MDAIRVSSSDLFHSWFQDAVEYDLDYLHWLISIDGSEAGLASSETDVCGSYSVWDLLHTIKVNFCMKDFLYEVGCCLKNSHLCIWKRKAKSGILQSQLFISLTYKAILRGFKKFLHSHNYDWEACFGCVQYVLNADSPMLAFFLF